MFVLKTIVTVILCLMFVVKSRQETPQYSYECKESGDIVLHGFSIDSTIQLTSVNGNNFKKTATCNSTYSSGAFGRILIPKGCTDGTSVTHNRTVVFRSVDSLIDGTTTTKSQTNAPIANTPSYGQRNHNFRIQCSMIKQGVVDHVIGHIGVKNVASLPNVFNSIGTVEMRFKSEEASSTNNINLEDLPDISTVYLGDKFYMYLKYIGDQAYYISPQNCTAYGDNEKAVVEKAERKKKVLLWTYQDCLSTDAISLHLMQNFKSSTKKIIYAEMFGFHFDFDADITIECDVKVCATSSNTDTSCTLKTNNNCTNKDWKVKRSTREEKDNRVTVKGQLHVLERKIGNSNSAGLMKFSLTSVVILQFLLYLV